MVILLPLLAVLAGSAGAAAPVASGPAWIARLFPRDAGPRRDIRRVVRSPKARYSAVELTYTSGLAGGTTDRIVQELVIVKGTSTIVARARGVRSATDAFDYVDYEVTNGTGAVVGQFGDYDLRFHFIHLLDDGKLWWGYPGQNMLALVTPETWVIERDVRPTTWVGAAWPTPGAAGPDILTHGAVCEDGSSMVFSRRTSTDIPREFWNSEVILLDMWPHVNWRIEQRGVLRDWPVLSSSGAYLACLRALPGPPVRWYLECYEVCAKALLWEKPLDFQGPELGPRFGPGWVEVPLA